MADRAQKIRLILSDGRSVTAMVPVFWEATEPTPKIISAEIGKPFDMPEGHTWGEAGKGGE